MCSCWQNDDDGLNLWLSVVLVANRATQLWKGCVNNAAVFFLLPKHFSPLEKLNGQKGYCPIPLWGFWWFIFSFSGLRYHVASVSTPGYHSFAAGEDKSESQWRFAETVEARTSTSVICGCCSNVDHGRLWRCPLSFFDRRDNYDDNDNNSGTFWYIYYFSRYC